MSSPKAEEPQVPAALEDTEAASDVTTDALTPPDVVLAETASPTLVEDVASSAEPPGPPLATAAVEESWQPASARRSAIALDRLACDAVLGEGSFGRCYKVHPETGSSSSASSSSSSSSSSAAEQIYYCLKMMPIHQVVYENMLEHVSLESTVMQLATAESSPFVCGAVGAYYTRKYLYIVMEYLPGGSLFFHLRVQPQPFSREHVLFYASELLCALQFLHERNIVYRDMKLENILLDGEGHIRLTDFGLCDRLTLTRPRSNSRSGSKVYIAPEVLSDQPHDYAVDWWGYGVLLHLLSTMQAPFWSEDVSELFEMIRDGDPVDLSSHESLDADLRDLIEKLLIRDSSQRLGNAGGFNEVKTHPFFKDVNWTAVLRKELTPPIVPTADFAAHNPVCLTEEEQNEKEDLIAKSIQESAIPDVIEGFAKSSVDVTFVEEPEETPAPAAAAPTSRGAATGRRGLDPLTVSSSSNLGLRVVVGNPQKVETFLDEHTAYTVSGTFQVDGVSHEVNVTRRYNHFLYLYNQLRVLHPDPKSLPSFPEKRIFDRFEPRVVELRRMSFQALLDSMSNTQVVLQAPVTHAFLGLQS
eukprot:CAMPEP_0174242246 /NCGR_PEP_ID=MMETSP0417-20130205/27039_1 /TAXON_ID=242541 /ORGANISM="Mayorella sp, Strain BSH-02190019" /LENGTH=584 /DNA_ID=CAMNT_0015321611 /DNA_START=173 /DNA_END=1924 /DNA_ORIENTATION=+